MRVRLHGGFGEKGRTSLSLESKGYRLLLDVGINTSTDRTHEDYYPAISDELLASMDALIITHSHEDHIAGLGWCLAHGFKGRVLMTREAADEADPVWQAYAEAEDRARAKANPYEPIKANMSFELGPLKITTGRSGHIVGGVWCVIEDGKTRFAYCGDVVPASPVLAMDALPACDVIAIDASYGNDAISGRDRAAAISAWITSHPQGCILPTPLLGRSIELFAIIPGAIALAPEMRAALETQLSASEWLTDGLKARLDARLKQAIDWQEGTALPKASLLCHDGMGMSGPARAILEAADQQNHPVLFTGHLPKNSPGCLLKAAGRADWIRQPTHPTLQENLDLITQTGASLILGHSCDPDTLSSLAQHMPALRRDLRTGDTLDIGQTS